MCNAVLNFLACTYLFAYILRWPVWFFEGAGLPIYIRQACRPVLVCGKIIPRQRILKCTGTPAGGGARPTESVPGPGEG